MKNKFGVGDMIYHLSNDDIWSGIVQVVRLKEGKAVYGSSALPGIDIPEDGAYATRAEALEALIAADNEKLRFMQKNVRRLEADIAALEMVLEEEKVSATNKQEEKQ